MKIRDKNANFQSCSYCNFGGSFYRIELDNGDVAYSCDKHKQEKFASLTKEIAKEPDFKME